MTSTHAAKAPVYLVLESERLFLRDLLASPDGVAAVTSAPAPYDRRPFPHGGKWRGEIPKSLARKGIITRLSANETRTLSSPATRPTRNKTNVLLWKLLDRSAAQLREAELAAKSRRPVERTLFDEQN